MKHVIVDVTFLSYIVSPNISKIMDCPSTDQILLRRLSEMKATRKFSANLYAELYAKNRDEHGAEVVAYTL